MEEKFDMQCIWVGCKNELIERTPGDDFGHLITFGAKPGAVLIKGSPLAKALTEKGLTRSDGGWVCVEHQAAALELPSEKPWAVSYVK
jgi:hypothetical protein